MLLHQALRPSARAQPPLPTPRPRPRPQAHHSSPPRLILGVDDDALKWTADPLAVVGRQRALGARAVRVWVPWQGEAEPGAVRRVELARAEQAARRTEVVLAVFGSARDTPATDAARARFCGYAAAALRLVPGARAVVVWNEANAPDYWNAGPTAYERLLARCYDALHAARPGIAVLDSTASAHGPEAFLLALGEAYRASGRTLPLVDAFGHNPYPRTSREEPATTHPPGFLGEGDYARLVAVLREAFAGTPQRSLAVWYLEDGFQTGLPRRLLASYAGRENAATVDPLGQAQRLEEAIRLAACQPDVRAFFNFELMDESRLAGWQSGLLWSDGAPKPAAWAFRRGAALVRAGRVACPAPAGAAAPRP